MPNRSRGKILLNLKGPTDLRFGFSSIEPEDKDNHDSVFFKVEGDDLFVCPEYFTRPDLEHLVIMELKQFRTLVRAVKFIVDEGMPSSTWYSVQAIRGERKK